MTTDTLGDRMKMYERMACPERLMPGLPTFMRLDGKNFSKFTKGLEKPFDITLSSLMIELTRYLVDETSARIGYTQSDEITLMWYSTNRKSQIYYDGRVQKMVSDSAATASVWFNDSVRAMLTEKASLKPKFDSRVWVVPNKEEAFNTFLWREKDCTKNSITCAAQTVYPHKALEGKNSTEKQEMLFQKGINWNDYPDFFKRGTFIMRKKELSVFSPKEIEKLPKEHEARKNPNLVVERCKLKTVHLPRLSSIVNRIEVLFDGAEPILKEENEKPSIEKAE